ncbi:hypothetical protein ElyMa_005771200 [Elysia marginata]|uniref:Uncharacterized protein n=1 Tax=Elysia marginata TaxID=1093978 RepID=A0AAV4FPB9_9GAST|nr:hypothetical protein ElyMa_005771200 [Elysia marginata]
MSACYAENRTQDFSVRSHDVNVIPRSHDVNVIPRSHDVNWTVVEKLRKHKNSVKLVEQNYPLTFRRLPRAARQNMDPNRKCLPNDRKDGQRDKQRGPCNQTGQKTNNLDYTQVTKYQQHVHDLTCVPTKTSGVRPTGSELALGDLTCPHTHRHAHFPRHAHTERKITTESCLVP